MCLKTAREVANSVYPEQILHSALSDQGVYTICISEICICLSVPICMVVTLINAPVLFIYLFFF